MSYEGYVVGLCENGHAWNVWDAYEDGMRACAHCHASIVKTWAVDQTNGDDDALDPRSNGTLRQTDGGRVERCNLGHNHVVEPPRFTLTDPAERD